MAAKMAATILYKPFRRQTIYFNLDLVSTAMFRELMNEARLFLVVKACWYKLNPIWCQRWQLHCNLTTGEISP